MANTGLDVTGVPSLGPRLVVDASELTGEAPMRLQQLRYIIAIAESGSINAAAHSLFVPQRRTANPP